MLTERTREKERKGGRFTLTPNAGGDSLYDPTVSKIIKAEKEN
jgi:hypothetical protein